MSDSVNRVAEHLNTGSLGEIDSMDLHVVLLLANGTADESWALNLDRVLGAWQDRNNNQRRSLDRMVNKFLRVRALIDEYERDLKPDLGVSAKETINKIRQELDK